MAALRRPTKNEKRRSKKKDTIEPAVSSANNEEHSGKNSAVSTKSLSGELDGIQIEYVSADYSEDIGLEQSILEQFRSVFDRFAKPEELVSENNAANSNQADADLGAESDQIEKKDEEESAESQKLSKRKKKLISRLTVAELKQLVHRPDVVEAHDVTSSDPRLLVHLKSYRNSVAVPRHWCHIRKYLTGKVGMEKPPFQLPEFIAETGIAKIRDAVMEQEAAKKSKAKARERVRPKMGKIDIDYQVLHDAFFKYQTKPKLTGHGDLYYEGKEYEVSMKEMKPGHMSKELINALGMLDGMPPPWLINMQRYGPPPSYPSMKIPGLSAPLPPGASYGYQPGGWGKPPVDEYNRPLYGDVFGQIEEDYTLTAEAVVDKSFRWGQVQAPEYAEDEDSETSDQAPGEDDDEDGPGGYDPSGAETPSTLAGSVTYASGAGMSGLETPDTVDLRKRAGMETPDSTYTSVANGGRELYHVIQERSNSGAAAVGQMFGSDRVYVLPNGAQAAEASEVEEDSDISAGQGKKRKIDSSAAAQKRMKEFKF